MLEHSEIGVASNSVKNVITNVTFKPEGEGKKIADGRRFPVISQASRPRCHRPLPNIKIMRFCEELDLVFAYAIDAYFSKSMH